MEEDETKRFRTIDHANKQSDTVGYSSYEVWLTRVKRHPPKSVDEGIGEDELAQDHEGS